MGAGRQETSRLMGNTATYLGIGNRTLYAMIDQGQVPAYKFGRVIRLRRTDVLAFLERQRIVLARSGTY
jgi:excisionase family DNA binding protein